MESTKHKLHKFLLEYQESHSQAPTMREIAVHFDTLGFRSSARDALLSLVGDGLVEEVKPVGYRRRYEAVPREGE